MADADTLGRKNLRATTHVCVHDLRCRVLRSLLGGGDEHSLVRRSLTLRIRPDEAIQQFRPDIAPTAVVGHLLETAGRKADAPGFCKVDGTLKGGNPGVRREEQIVAIDTNEDNRGRVVF